MTLAILASVFGGTFFGSFLGPLLLEEWKSFRQKRRWLLPKQKLARQIFHRSGMATLSLADLARAFGCELQEAREVLSSLGGIGVLMPDGQEGWILDHSKLTIEINQLDRKS